ncbi:hypothetical protein JNJ66_06980 [Candidatus Saccharibacteria bacterium]|nr:hypothetical protein [Candidatus Saccharibacteria bacterium]
MNKLFKKIAAASTAIATLAFVATVSFATPVLAACTADVNGNPLANGVGCGRADGTPEELIGDGGIFTTVANILIFLVGLIAVIMLIIGGIRYAVSGGDQSAVTAAKNTILYAIIGLVVAFMAFAVVNFVTTQLTNAAG